MSGFSAGEGYLDIAATLDTKQARNEAGQFQKELKTIGQQLSKDLTYIFQTGANAGVTRLRREMDAAGYAAGEGFVNKMRAGMSAAPGALGSAAALALTGSVAATVRSMAKTVSQHLAVGLRNGVPVWKKSLVDGFRFTANDSVKSLVDGIHGNTPKIVRAYLDVGDLITRVLGESLGKAANAALPKLGALGDKIRTTLGGSAVRAINDMGVELALKLSGVFDKALVPVASGMAKIAEAMHRGFTNAVSKAGDALKWFPQQFALVATGAKAAAEKARAALVSGFQSAAISASVHLQRIVNFFRDTFPGLGTHIRTLGNTVKTVFQRMAQDMFNGAKLGADKIKTAFTKAFDPIKTKAKDLGNRIQQALSNAAAKSKRAMDNDVGRGVVASFKLAAAGAASAALGMAAAGVAGAAAVIKGFNSATGGLRAVGAKMAQWVGAGLKAAGGALLSAAGALAKGTAKAFGDGLKLAGNAVATAFATVAGVAAAKGWSRLKTIDQAEASLKGLNATAKHVPQIMDAANQSVLGTAFGLDQAANAAKLFATAGVPVSDMERRLKSLANTAAAAEGDYKGMADVFSKVAAGTSAMGTQGRLTAVELQQMRARGVNALAALSEHMGISQGDVRKLVTQGKIDFATFSDAMEQSLGKQAIMQATTFSGIMSNVGSALGRLGQVAMRPIFNSLKDVLPGVINLLNQLQLIINPIAEAIGSRLEPVATKLGAAFEKFKLGNVSMDLQGLAGSLGVLAPILGGVATAFSGPLLTKIPIVGSLFSGLTGPVGILGGALVALFAIKPDTLLAGVDSLAAKLPGMLDTVVNAVTELIPKMAERFAANAPVLIQGLVTLITSVAESVGTIVPVLIPAAVEMVKTLAEGLIDNIPLLVAGAVDLVTGLVDAVAELAPTLIMVALDLVIALAEGLVQALPELVASAYSLLEGLAQGILEALPVLIAVLPELITALLEGLLEQAPTLIPMGVEIILALVMGIVEAIPQLIDAVVNLIPVLADTIVTMLPVIIAAAVKLILGLVTGIGQALPSVVAALFRLLTTLVVEIGKAAPKVLAEGLKVFKGIGTAVTNAWSTVKSSMDSLKNKILGFFSGAGKWLLDSGKKMINGLTDGIRSAFNGAKSAVQNGLKGLRNLLPFSPAKEGPFSGRGWTEYSGRALGDGFVNSTVAALAVGETKIANQLEGVAALFGSGSTGMSGYDMGRMFATTLAAGLLSAKRDVERAGDAIAQALKTSLGDAGTLGGVTVRGDARKAVSVPLRASGQSSTEGSVRLSREDLDYLAAKLAAALWPAAKAANMVNDLATFGANRVRRGSV